LMERLEKNKDMSKEDEAELRTVIEQFKKTGAF